MAARCFSPEYFLKVRTLASRVIVAGSTTVLMCADQLQDTHFELRRPVQVLSPRPDHLSRLSGVVGRPVGEVRAMAFMNGLELVRVGGTELCYQVHDLGGPPDKKMPGGSIT